MTAGFPKPKPLTIVKPRCWRCNKMFAKVVTAPFRFDCPRCKAVTQLGDHDALAAADDPGLPVS